jgi:hypothetical protein
LVNNFNTLVFMRSREAETAVHAHIALGTRLEKSRKKPPEEGGFLGLLPPPSSDAAVTEIPVCPMGALGQLDVHQAFVVFADGKRTEFPVWFAPWFELPASKNAGEKTAVSATFTSVHVQQLMTQAGFRSVFSSQIVVAAAEVWKPRRSNTLERAVEFFRGRACQNPPYGLDKLPECWIAALPGILWRLRKPHWTHLPFFIDRLDFQDGVLLISFAQEQANPDQRLTAWDKIRVKVNPFRFHTIVDGLHDHFMLGNWVEAIDARIVSEALVLPGDKACPRLLEQTPGGRNPRWRARQGGQSRDGQPGSRRMGWQD